MDQINEDYSAFTPRGGKKKPNLQQSLGGNKNGENTSQEIFPDFAKFSNESLVSKHSKFTT
jgi:hypothetical protein